MLWLAGDVARTGAVDLKLFLTEENEYLLLTPPSFPSSRKSQLGPCFEQWPCRGDIEI